MFSYKIICIGRRMDDDEISQTPNKNPLLTADLVELGGKCGNVPYFTVDNLHLQITIPQS